MIKKLLMAAIAATAVILPVGAEVQPGTSSLLETIQDNGILVTINPDACLTNGSNGQYRWLGFKREMILCPGRTVDGEDHNTVRHEVIHAIQHCVNVARGTSTDTAVMDDTSELMRWARQYLSIREIKWIQDNYDRSQWATEIEAFAGARAYTSSELEELFLGVCTLQETDV